LDNLCRGTRDTFKCLRISTILEWLISTSSLMLWERKRIPFSIATASLIRLVAVESMVLCDSVEISRAWVRVDCRTAASARNSLAT
jgi:hypothetical protein